VAFLPSEKVQGAVVTKPDKEMLDFMLATLPITEAAAQAQGEAMTPELPEKVKAWIIDYLGAEFSPLEKRDLTELAILAAECARADAARYRWLADKVIAPDYGDNDSDPPTRGYHIKHCKGPRWIGGDSLDAAIDAAINAEAGCGGESEAHPPCTGATKPERRQSSAPDHYPDTEADGVVFCGKCGKPR
jgi:hypothetical protein